jgi:arylsulfatase A-like enzyme
MAATMTWAEVSAIAWARRGTWLTTLVACLFLLTAPARAGQAQQQHRHDRRPNILLILADDLGPGDLGCYGQTIIRKPNVDRLANEGMRFTTAYTGSPVCGPSRCSLLTGLHTGHCYVRDNKELKPAEGQLPIPDDAVTLAELLKHGGYATACIGKWGLGPPGSSGDPITQGFDFFYGHNCQRVAHNHYTDHVWHNDEKVVLDGNTPGNVTGRQYVPDLMADQAVRWIRRHKDQPFFLDFATPLPHVSLQAPADAVAAYVDRIGPEEPMPRRGDYVPCAHPRATYAAMVTRMDDHVGRLLAELKSLGLEDDTVVIFASDNGPTFQRVGGHPEFFRSALGLRGLKEDVYEGGIRCPLVVRYPGHVRPGSTSDFVTALYDLFPTALDLAHLPAPTKTDGVSIVPTLTGHADAQKPHDYLYWEFGPRGGQKAIRQGNWKLVQVGLKRNPHVRPELYDLATDPTESHDVARAHPDVVERLMALMRSAHTPSDQPNWNF